MAAEIEAKFLEIDREDMRGRLKAAGYACVQEDCLMRRVVFDVPGGGRHVWARVRDEGGVITMSYKRTHDAGRADGTEEIQIVADDFDRACALLSACGLVRKSYQETRRETWRRGGIEATLDLWPALPPFMEIEAPDETALKDAAAELNLDWDRAKFGAVGPLYTQYHGVPVAAINSLPRLTFDNEDDVRALRVSAS